MEDVERIYILLIHSNGLKIRDIAKELDLDKYYVAEIMFSIDNIPYWYQDDSTLWFAKEGAIQIEEGAKEDELTAPLVAPKVIKVERFLKGTPSASLRSYIDQLAKYRRYSADEIRELFIRYRSGDRKAYELIVKSYLKTVVGFAYIYRRDGVQIEDLIQEGNMGLIRAIEHYDHLRGGSFLNYAKSWIFQAISYSLSYQPYIIKLPINQYSLYYKVRKIIDKYEQQNGFPPSANDIEIDNYDNYKNISYLLNLPDSLKEITCLVEDLDSYECSYNKIVDIENEEYNRDYVNSLLSHLKGRAETIVRLYFGIGTTQKTLNDIGNMFNLTRERVRQILEKSIRSMRKRVFNKEYDDETDEKEMPQRVVESIKEAAIGDCVKMPGSISIGKVIDILKAKGDVAFYVLKNERGEIYKFSKDGTLIITEEKEKIKKKRTTPEREAFLKELYKGKLMEEKPKDSSNNSQNSSAENKTSHQAIPQRFERPIIRKEAVVGDIIQYGSKRCVVIEKRNAGGSPRLIVKYDNGTLDNLPNNKARYTVL